MEGFVKPEMEVVAFEEKDVILTSCSALDVGGSAPDMGCDESLGDPEF